MLTQLLLPLLSFVIVSGVEQENVNRQVTATVIVRQIGLPTLEKAMLDVLERHPESDRWSGNDKKQIFGIVVVPFTDRDVKDDDLGMFRKTAGQLATKEMLLAKVLLDRFAETGLTDPGTLRQAAAEANESLVVRAKIDYSIKETYIEGKRIIGIAVADREKITTTVTDQVQTKAVRDAYRQLVRRDAATLIQKRNFEQALLRLQELRKADLFDRECLSDVLRCFVGLDRPDEAEKIVESLTGAGTDDVEHYRRLAEIVASGRKVDFRRMADRLQKEIDRLDPPEATMEETLNQMLNELSN